MSKRLAEMTPEERSEYRRQKNEERHERYEAQRLMERERAGRIRDQFGKAWDGLMKRNAEYETEATARQLLAALSPQALSVLRLWRLAEKNWHLAREYGDEIAERVRIATGIKPKPFALLLLSLASVGALLPNDYSGWASEQTYNELGGDQGNYSILYQESPAEAVGQALVRINGYRLNQALVELLTAEPDLQQAA